MVILSARNLAQRPQLQRLREKALGRADEKRRTRVTQEGLDEARKEERKVDGSPSIEALGSHGDYVAQLLQRCRRSANAALAQEQAEQLEKMKQAL